VLKQLNAEQVGVCVVKPPESRMGLNMKWMRCGGVISAKDNPRWLWRGQNTYLEL